jgi:hypothetical protein
MRRTVTIHGHERSYLDSGTGSEVAVHPRDPRFAPPVLVDRLQDDHRGHAASRRAFLATTRAVIDPWGQTINAHDYLPDAAPIPTFIVWGSRDRMIPAWHAISAQKSVCETPEVDMAKRRRHQRHERQRIAKQHISRLMNGAVSEADLIAICDLSLVTRRIRFRICQIEGKRGPWKPTPVRTTRISRPHWVAG